MEAYLCRHRCCRGEVNGKRHAYTDGSARNRHERLRYDHTCFKEEGTCKCCTKWKEEAKGKPCPDVLYLCRHEGCNRYYPTKRGRREHENTTHDCPTSCRNCTQRQAKKKRKQENLQREEEEKRLEEERKRQRVEHTRGMLEKINSFPWETLNQQHLDEPQANFLSAKAETLLELLYDMPFPECLIEIGKVDPRLITYLFNTNPTLRELSCQPPTDTLLALKDQLYIPDHAWPLVCAVFNLGRQGSLATLRNRRSEINNLLPTVQTPSGQGSAIPLIKFIEYLIVCNPEGLQTLLQVVFFSTCC